MVGCVCWVVLCVVFVGRQRGASAKADRADPNRPHHTTHHTAHPLTKQTTTNPQPTPPPAARSSCARCRGTTTTSSRPSAPCSAASSRAPASSTRSSTTVRGGRVGCVGHVCGWACVCGSCRVGRLGRACCAFCLRCVRAYMSGVGLSRRVAIPVHAASSPPLILLSPPSTSTPYNPTNAVNKLSKKMDLGKQG